MEIFAIKQYENLSNYASYERICQLISTPFVCLRVSQKFMWLLSQSYRNLFSRCGGHNTIFMTAFSVSPRRMPPSLAQEQLSSTFFYRNLAALVWVANRRKREGFWRTKTGHFNFLCANISRLRELILLVSGVVNCPQREETRHRVSALQDFYLYMSLHLSTYVAGSVVLRNNKQPKLYMSGARPTHWSERQGIMTVSITLWRINAPK
jgi:hypothetical protein